MPSLYAQYLKERIGRGILETEGGFATFDYISDEVVYIVDLFVVPEKRKTRIAASIADAICEQAVKDGKKFLLGSVDTTANGADISAKVLEAYGMKVHKIASPMIFYIKELVKEEVNNG